MIFVKHLYPNINDVIKKDTQLQRQQHQQHQKTTTNNNFTIDNFLCEKVKIRRNKLARVNPNDQTVDVLVDKNKGRGKKCRQKKCRQKQ